ncbi:MAG: hypothetical protein Q9213_000852 [Squamulea squamosa]
MSPGKRHSLHLDLSIAHSDGLPRIAALFLIQFDIKAGYFVHNDEYAGISSFVNGEAEVSERNALMLAVGALIPLSYGRLGRSWRYADELKSLAKKLVKDPSSFEHLEEAWKEHQLQEDEEAARPTSGEGSPSALKDYRRQAKSSPYDQPKTRNRAVSSASALAPPGQTLSNHHPALSLSTYLDIFGPLVFPLYKAALLRKRVLLLGRAPIELACKFVYNISILSTLPSAIHNLLPLSPLPTRLRTLFSVGVHDTLTLTTGSRNSVPKDTLAAEGQAYGWIACTTDDILSTKNDLYDILARIPLSSPTHAEIQTNRIWPRLQSQKGVRIRATQRDARRYRALRQDLDHYHSSSSRPPSAHRPERYTDDTDPHNDNTPLLPLASLSHLPTDPDPPPPELDQTDILESQSWSALAYNSFIWWASAGETRTDREEEAEYDSALLANLDPSGETPSPGMNRGKRNSASPEGGDRVGFEMAVIGYFHRLTVLILRTLADIVDAANDRDDGGDSLNGRDDGREEDIIVVEVDDMARMGLDIWSESDKVFVEELVEFYWGRKAVVKGGRVECCGVRVM